MNCLVPRDEYLPTPTFVNPASIPMLPDIMRMQPVSPLTDRAIATLSRVRRKELITHEAEARISALTGIARDQASIASTWLHTRLSDERNILIKTAAKNYDRSWFFGNGERMRVTTQVSIW